MRSQPAEGRAKDNDKDHGGDDPGQFEQPPTHAARAQLLGHVLVGRAMRHQLILACPPCRPPIVLGMIHSITQEVTT